MQQSFKNLNTLPQISRVWVYPSTKVFSDEEVKTLSAKLDVFLFQWAAHGSKLMAQGHVLFNRFVVVMLDEALTSASGCSIDTLMHFIQEQEKNYNTSFTDRMLINYLEGDEIKDVRLSDVKGKLIPETKFFNHLVNTKADFENNWITPVNESWLGKYIL